MVKLDPGSTLQRWRNRYRLVVMNDDTYEEVVTFKLSRLSVYVMLSSIFVILTGLTVALIVFTPLKYYIPGTGSNYRSVVELKALKYRVDELEKLNHDNVLYIEGIRKALGENNTKNLDTTRLNVPKPELSDD